MVKVCYVQIFYYLLGKFVRFFILLLFKFIVFFILLLLFKSILFGALTCLSNNQNYLGIVTKIYPERM